MAEVELYIRNQDRYHGILQFLNLAIQYWDEEENNSEKADEGREYRTTIQDQRPRAPGPYEMTVPEELADFAAESAQGVDFIAWEVRDLREEDRGDVKRALRTLKSLND